MNNRVTITFNSVFTAGDNIGVYYSDPSTQTSGYWTFVWVSGTAGVFEVQQGTSEATTAENFATAWSNSLNGFTVVRSSNQVEITSQTYHFVNVLAKFADGSTMAISGDYAYALSTQVIGNKITYEEKFPLNTPTADSKYLWKSVNANEVKEKFNLNDDRIGILETNKADLVGGNDFTGDQKIDGNVGIGTTSPDSLLHVQGSAQLGDNNDSNGDLTLQIYSGERQVAAGTSTLEILAANASDAIWGRAKIIVTSPTPSSSVMAFETNVSASATAERMRVHSNGNVGIGTTTPSEKLEVAGNIKLGTGNLGTIDIDGSWQIVHGTSALNFKRGSSNYVILSPTGHNITGNTTAEGNIYERFDITILSTSDTLEDAQRVLHYNLAGNGTLDIPDSLNNKVWEIFVTGSQLTVQPESGSSVTLSIVHNGQSNDGVISSKHSAKLIRTATNGYTLIKY